MTTMTEIASAVLMLEAVLGDLDELLTRATPDQLELEPALVARSILGTAGMGLGQCRDALDQLIAERMDKYEVTVEGIGVVKRHRNKSRRNWDSEGLLRLVLDSRVLNEETGEVESQVDALRNVYGLKGYNASLKQLTARGVPVDEFCESEERGWKLQIT